jgi:hypothetical protein
LRATGAFYPPFKQDRHGDDIIAEGSIVARIPGYVKEGRGILRITSSKGDEEVE